MDPRAARAAHQVLEPIHATVYFQAEAKSAYEAIGLKGYWMGYFASRAAAMGPVPPEIVIATFYNFAPQMVRRAIPDAWRFSSVERVLAARYEIARTATELLTGGGDLTEAADLAERAARAASTEGRALFAAHAGLPWPDEPALRLWHAATLLREHRGDGHVALLLAQGVDGLEAHLLHAAAGKIDAAQQRQHRGWTDEDWAAAAERLRARGLLDAEQRFTDAGRAFKERLEQRTDELAAPPYDAIGDDGTERLDELLSRFVGGVPYPNAMGLSRR